MPSSLKDWVEAMLSTPKEAFKKKKSKYGIITIEE